MADEITKVIRIEAQGSETSVKQLRQEIASLRDALLNTQKGSDEYKNTVEKLTATQNKLNDVMKAGKEVFVGSKQELKSLKMQLDQLQEGTAEYNAAFQRAAEITHTLQERQEMLKYSSADVGTQLQNIVSIGGSLAAGFNAMNAVMTLTGKKNEDLQKAMVKLQAGIALVQGLQGLEGMEKRLKGLVNGLTTMISKTAETTVAVKAETTAVQANATAQEANTVATAGATVATNAFKKALISTGIGAIIVLLGTLIAHWEDLKDMIGLSNEKLDAFNAIMDKVRTVLGGVSNVIFNAFVASVKNAITAIVTLGKAVKDVFTLNFTQLQKDVKEGWDKIGETTKKGLAISTNYQEGAAKTAAKIQEKRTREQMEALATELNETIKDNEAKYGSDWKYTQEGKKLYDQYFDAKLKALKKDSQEYREANREKMAYDREYAEHNKKVAKEVQTTAKETTDQMLKEAEKIEKRAQDSLKTEEELLTEKYEEEKALLIQYHKDTEALEKEYQNNLKKIREKAAAEEQAEKDRKKRQEEQDLADRTKIALKMSDRRLQTAEDTNTQAVATIALEYSLKEAKQSASLSFDELIEETNRIYQANKEHLEAQAAEYKSLMDNTEIDKEVRENAERDYNNTMAELRNLDTQNLIDNLNLQRDAVEQQIKMYSDMAKAIGDIFGSIADIMEEDIKAKIKNGEITQEEGEKQFEAVKAFQIAQATINTIAGAIAAFMGCQSLGQPWGAIIGAVQAAAVTAAGIAQIQKIKNTQLGGGGSSISGQMSAAAAQTQPEEYVAPYTQNATGESEIVNLANSIKDQRVYVLEADITDAQNRQKVRVKESQW